MTSPQEEHILVRSPNWLGDACMALPAVKSLTSLPGFASLTVFCPANLEGFWARIPEVTHVIPRPPKCGLREAGALIRAAGIPFTRGILLPNSSRSALEMKFGGVKNLTGYKGQWRSLLLSDTVPTPVVTDDSAPLHQRDRYLAIALYLGAKLKTVTSAPLPDAGGRGPLTIGICAGAEYGGAKRWPTENFAKAMRLLDDEFPGIDWVFFGVPKEQALGEELERHYDRPCRNLIGKTKLGELMDELGKCRLLITNDTGTMHLADALGVPVAAIFGSTEPALSGPSGPLAEVIREKVPCSPCFLRECPIDFPCMRKIAPDRVAAAGARILAHGN